VAKNVKFHSSLIQIGLFTAESAGRKEEAKEEDTKAQANRFNSIYS